MKGLALYESASNHTKLAITWLKAVMSKLESPVELLTMDITNSCAVRPDAPPVFCAEGSKVDLQGVSFIVVAGPVYCCRPDIGMMNLISDKKRFNIPQELKDVPMFGFMVCDMIASGSRVYLYESLKNEGYDVRNSYSIISPQKTKPGKDKSFNNILRENAMDIVKLASLNKEKKEDKEVLDDVASKLKVSKPVRIIDHAAKQGGLGCRAIGHSRCKIETEKCVGCGKCSKLCMRGVIEIIKGDDGKKKAVLVNPKGCLGCGRCFENCPVHAITKPTHIDRHKLWVNDDFEKNYGKI